jgi:hypothetical protein
MPKRKFVLRLASSGRALACMRPWVQSPVLKKKVIVWKKKEFNI